MANYINTSITRYDLEHERDEDSTMVKHHSGDYVEYSDHHEIVTALQDELAAIKRKVEQALSYLSEIG